MSNSEDLNLILIALEDIPSNSVSSPTVPVTACIQEAEDLAVWCVDDRVPLEAAGLDWGVAEEIPTRAGALRHAESLWSMAIREDDEDAAQWVEESAKAIDYRAVLLHRLRFAFSDHPKLLVKLREVSRGNKQRELMQALSRLSVIGNNHLDLLAAVGITPSELEVADRYSDELAVRLAASKKSEKELTGKRLLRDRAYLYLKEGVDKVRKYGRFLFWRTPERLVGYVSEYFRQYRSGTQSTPADSEPNVDEGPPVVESLSAPVEAPALGAVEQAPIDMDEKQ
ncbi:MAG: hypothetical protein GY765_43570 [bacterium]|nr:hypothetical protein [bacterium]